MDGRLKGFEGHVVIIGRIDLGIGFQYILARIGNRRPGVKEVLDAIAAHLGRHDRDAHDLLDVGIGSGLVFEHIWLDYIQDYQRIMLKYKTCPRLFPHSQDIPLSLSPSPASLNRFVHSD